MPAKAWMAWPGQRPGLAEGSTTSIRSRSDDKARYSWLRLSVDSRERRVLVRICGARLRLEGKACGIPHLPKPGRYGAPGGCCGDRGQRAHATGESLAQATSQILQLLKPRQTFV